MKSLPRLLLCLCAGLLAHQASANPAFNGQWKLDPAQSTSLDPWSALAMDITVQGDRLSLVRHYSAGTRVAQETLNLANQAQSQTVTVEGWWDNRHIDAWLAHDNRIEVTPEWRDEGRTLQLNITMVLETQQGEIPVTVTRTLQLSEDGQTLREVQQRSSRKRPVIHVYQKL
jgi:hypothetical protein